MTLKYVRKAPGKKKKKNMIMSVHVCLWIAGPTWSRRGDAAVRAVKTLARGRQWVHEVVVFVHVPTTDADHAWHATCRQGAREDVVSLRAFFAAYAEVWQRKKRQCSLMLRRRAEKQYNNNNNNNKEVLKFWGIIFKSGRP